MSCCAVSTPVEAPSLVQQARGLAMYVLDDNAKVGDANRPFAQAIAWSSYFVLVFVGQCVFNQPAMAAAITGTGELMGLLEQARTMDAMLLELRGTI